MTKMLTPSDIAVLVESRLNEKAAQLFEAGEVNDKIVFNVTSDYQLYERMQKAEYELDDYQPFSPVIISRINHYEYPADYTRYEESYSFGLYGYADQIDDLERIIKEYTVEENTTNKTILVGGFRITKEATDVDFDKDIEPKDGSLRKRVIGSGGFSWTFLDGIMTSYDTIVTIDGEEMPYIDWSWERVIGSIQTQTINSTGQTSNYINTKNYLPSIVLPYISTSPVIVELYRELWNNVYNKSHTLTYYDTALDETFTYPVRIVAGSFSDTQPKVLDFGLVFERIMPTVTVKIDDIEVPVLDFDITTVAELSTTTQIASEESESVYLGVNYQITMSLDISDLTNTKTEELLYKVLEQRFQTPHIITMTKGTVSMTYQVTLNNGNYSFSANTADKINLLFVKVDGDV